MEEITLIIEGEVFKARKDVLCEHSDYFRAMFSGNYKENEQKEIKIDVVDAESMKLILEFMNNGHVDLTDITTFVDLAVSANFLQINELMIQIEYTLTCKLCPSNWLTTLTIAENISSSKLELSAVAYGILSFQSMEPEHIPTIHQLHWYLSHPYLDINSEFQVFKFGFDWVVLSNYSADALLVVLSCLDLRALTKMHIEEISKVLLEKFKGSLPTKIVQCLLDIVSNNIELSVDKINHSKQSLCEKYTEHVYNEVLSLINSSWRRKFQMIPCVPITEISEDTPRAAVEEDSSLSKPSSSKETSKPSSLKEISSRPHYMYQFHEDCGFEKWLEIAPSSLWGWSVTSWGPTKLVVVGGEYGKGSGSFMRDLSVFDTLNKEWMRHGVEFPPRRHAGIVVMGNKLYIVGGVGSYRVILSSCLIYDLELHTYKKIADLPDLIQNPAVCAHQGDIYVGGQKNIYKYNSDKDEWIKILNTDLRINHLLSFEGFLYGTQSYFCQLYRFKPNECQELETVTSFENAVCAICNAGKYLVAFTATVVSLDATSVEVFENGKTRVIWSNQDKREFKYQIAGCCSLVSSLPTKNPVMSTFAKKYLSLFNNV